MASDYLLDVIVIEDEWGDTSVDVLWICGGDTWMAEAVGGGGGGGGAFADDGAIKRMDVRRWIGWNKRRSSGRRAS